VTTFSRSEGLFLNLALSFERDLKALLTDTSANLLYIMNIRAAYLSRIENHLYLFENVIFVLVDLRIGIHRLLDEKLDVPQLAEVEIAFAFQPGNSFLEHIVFLY
jgi:hypothetical protein